MMSEELSPSLTSSISSDVFAAFRIKRLLTQKRAIFVPTGGKRVPLSQSAEKFRVVTYQTFK